MVKVLAVSIIELWSSAVVDSDSTESCMLTDNLSTVIRAHEVVGTAVFLTSKLEFFEYSKGTAVTLGIIYDWPESAMM